MKKILLTLFAILAVSVSASAYEIIRGQKTFGVRTGFVTLNRAPTAGLEFSYAFSPHFVLAPSIDYAFRNNNLDGLLFNIDYHGPWQLDRSGHLYFYHILGVNYASWSTHHPAPFVPAASSGEGDTAPTPPLDTNDDVTTRYNRFGLDFGAGLSLYVTPTLRLSLQGKFNWLKGHNTGVFNLGISYVF